MNVAQVSAMNVAAALEAPAIGIFLAGSLVDAGMFVSMKMAVEWLLENEGDCKVGSVISRTISFNDKYILGRTINSGYESVT